SWISSPAPWAIKTARSFRSVFKFQGACIQKDRAVFFAHGAGELIHDAAVHSVEIIFGILSDKSQILHSQLFNPVQILQHQSSKNLQGSGGGKPGTVGDISVDQEINSGVKCVSSFFESPHNSLWIIGPSRFF